MMSQSQNVAASQSEASEEDKVDLGEGENAGYLEIPDLKATLEEGGYLE